MISLLHPTDPQVAMGVIEGGGTVYKRTDLLTEVSCTPAVDNTFVKHTSSR